MLQIDRIAHVGLVVADAEPALRLYEGLFGFRRRWASEADGARRTMLEVPGRTDLGWEVIEVDGDPDLQAFLDGPRGPGVHHVTVDVPDMAQTTQALLDLEVPTAAAGPDVLVLEPEAGGQGIRFQLRGPQAPGDPTGDTPAAAAAGDAPQLGIVGVDHVCHACPDRDELGGWYTRVFGMRETHRTPPGQHEDLADLVLDVPGTQMRWEVLQPVGEGSFVERFLSTRGPSVHHIAFQVENWEHAMAACEAHEVPTFDPNSGETDGVAWCDAFIHPRHTGGVLLQLFWEAGPDAWVASDKVPSDKVPSDS